jgi:cytoskeleton protein RodZ
MKSLDFTQIEQLKQIADYLYQQRQEKEIPLEKVAKDTFIPLRLLQALEASQFDRLPEPVYIKGFLRRYAEVLGLNGPEVASGFQVEPAALAQAAPLRPEVQRPEIQRPEVQHPVPSIPKIQRPEPTAPEIQRSLAQQLTPSSPPSQNSDLQPPEAPLLEIPEFGLQMPDVEPADSQFPDLKFSDTQSLQVQRPELQRPEVQRPELQRPEVQRPELKRPEPLKPLAGERQPGVSPNGRSPESLVADRSIQYEPIPSPEDPTARRGFLPWILAGLGLGAAAAIGFVLIKPAAFNASSGASNSQITTVSPESVPESNATPSDSPPAAATTTPDATPSPNAAASGDTPVQVEVKLTDDSWLEVVADGKVEYEGVLPKNEQRTWKAQKNLIIRSGNAGAVLASYNEGEAKPMGKLGDVVELEFPQP